MSVRLKGSRESGNAARLAALFQDVPKTLKPAGSSQSFFPAEPPREEPAPAEPTPEQTQAEPKPQQPKPSKKRSKAHQEEKKARTVFCGNLPISVTKKRLRAILSRMGHIESIRFRSVPNCRTKQMADKIVRWRTGAPEESQTQTAFVVFSTPEAAQTAVTRCQGHVTKDECIPMHDHHLELAQTMSGSSSKKRPAETETPTTTTTITQRKRARKEEEEEVEMSSEDEEEEDGLFTNYDDEEEEKKGGGRDGSCGGDDDDDNEEEEEEEEGRDVFSPFHWGILRKEGLVINGLHVRVDHAVPSQPDEKLSVFVGDLPFDADDESLREHFAVCGKVAFVRIVREPKTMQSKGFAFVQFWRRQSRSAALSMSGNEFKGRALRVFPANLEQARQERAERAEIRAARTFRNQQKRIFSKVGSKRRVKAARHLEQSITWAQETISKHGRDAVVTAPAPQKGAKKEASTTDSTPALPAAPPVAPAPQYPQGQGQGQGQGRGANSFQGMRAVPGRAGDFAQAKLQPKKTKSPHAKKKRVKGKGGNRKKGGKRH